MWLLYAVGSSFFAGITSILAKCGIRKTDSDIATAIRTCVVFLFSWLLTALTGAYRGIGQISGPTLLFLILSGLATGASWLCYFHALQKGDINKVVPIDKSSTILTILLALIFFHEGMSLKKGTAVVLIAIGTFLMITKKESDATDADSGQKSWLIYAILSAIFASLTAILGKIGISGIDSNLGTAIRTTVVLFMAWIHGICQVKSIGASRHFPPGDVFYLSVRTCHRCILALLLPCSPGGTCQRHRSDRQAEYSRHDRILTDCLPRKTHKKNQQPVWGC